MRTRPRLRRSEWVLLAFFLYVALVAALFVSAGFRPLSPLRELPLLILAAALVLVGSLALGEARGPTWLFSYARDWAPLVLTLTAYREMDWFSPRQYDYHLEKAWIVWDRFLLDDWGGRAVIESAGALLPGYFELSYLLVYAVGPFTLAMVYAADRRDIVDRILVLYLAGTLTAYALFPYFPSLPPRTVFPDADLPRVLTSFRGVNLSLLRGYGIHSSVFPSAHVSSAFAAAWGLIRFLPEKRWMGRGMLIYAISVAIATVYGRYHYTVDALAGVVVSLLAAIFESWLRADSKTVCPRDEY